MNVDKSESKKSAPISLRLASQSDIPLILELEKTVSGSRTNSYLADQQEVEEHLAFGPMYLIEKGGIAVGDISYEIKDPDRAHITGLAVSPEFSGQGIGRAATIMILDELKDFKRIDLVTHPENARAISLYESLGFVIESRKEDYFGDGEPRIVLVKIREKNS